MSTTDQSIQPFIAELAARGDLVEITRPLRSDFELAAALALFDRGPAVRATQVEGSPFPVVGNVLSSRERIALALRVPASDILDRLTEAFETTQDPVLVDDPKCQEVTRPVEELWQTVLAPKFFEEDSGGYISAGMIVAHDPVTGHRNASYARIKPLGPTTGFIGIAPNHHLTAMARSAASEGQPLPIAVAIGAHPALQLAACFYLGLGDDELAHGAHLLGEPVRVARAMTSEVLVPADADVVAEGVIHGDKPIYEGLVSEYHGMYEDYGDGLTVEFTAVTHRRDAVYQTILPGLAAEHAYLGALPIAAGLRAALRRSRYPVSDVAVTLAGGGRVDVVVSLSSAPSGVARRVILACFASVSMVKQVTVVDDEVDVWDAEHVQWARTTRMRWERDLLRIEDVGTDRNVPGQQGGTVTKVGMDATARQDDRKPGPQLAVPPLEDLQRVRSWLVDEGHSNALAPAMTLFGADRQH